MCPQSRNTYLKPRSPYFERVLLKTADQMNTTPAVAKKDWPRAISFKTSPKYPSANFSRENSLMFKWYSPGAMFGEKLTAI